jgi:hypothetical protein
MATPHYRVAGKPERYRVPLNHSSMMNMNEALQETDNAPDTHVDIDENEVKEIIESIKEAHYFDASSMAPLSPASMVSIFDIYLRKKL